MNVNLWCSINIVKHFAIEWSLIKLFFFFAIFFLFHSIPIHVSCRHFACLFNEILNIFISILLFLCSIFILLLLLLHLHLHLHSIGLLLFLCHICELLFILLLLYGGIIFLFCHSLWNTLSHWCILDNMSICTWFYFIIIWLIWLSVLWWWNVLSFTFEVKFDTLYKFQNSIINNLIFG